MNEQLIDFVSHIYQLPVKLYIKINCNTFKTTTQKSIENNRFYVYLISDPKGEKTFVCKILRSTKL